jgi:hypothetical protein
VTGETRYPFGPKSITRLRAGQFWGVPLSGGRHACGRVLHVPGADESLYLNSRTFLAGLMDWSGAGPPTNEAIAGCGVLAQGMMHVAAIRDTSSLIIGQRDLELDEITGLGFLPEPPTPGEARRWSKVLRNLARRGERAAKVPGAAAGASS